MGKKDKNKGDAAFQTGAPSTTRTLMGPQEIQQKEFRVSRFGGYKMRDVDEFLDTVTDSMSALVADNDRLRKGAPAPVVGAPDLDDVSRQADEIIQRARTEAARIIAEAKVQDPAGASTPQDRAAVNAFLSKEREFLQSLAGLVQGHAETVNGMSKAAKTAAKQAQQPATAKQPETAQQPETAKQPEAPRTPSEDEAPLGEAAPVQEATAVQESLAEEAPTQVPESDAAVRVGEPEPAAARADDDASPEGDRSLRDLFWGED